MSGTTLARGKGYALDFLLREMERHAHNEFDGYIVLDADNVLERDFVSRMNETFSEGKGHRHLLP